MATRKTTTPAPGKKKGEALLDEIMGGGPREALTISPPNFLHASFLIAGDAPYVQNKFSQKAMDMMIEAQKAGSAGRNKKKREGKDFEAAYTGAMHIAEEGWHGIPASSLRNAMISACRIVSFKMTIAKLSLFVEPDGFDSEDGTPLIKIIQGEPNQHKGLVRLATGVADIRVRPMWRPGWRARPRLRWDGDQFGLVDVANLMMRVGGQVGLGEGRPDSKNSAGMGWGTFYLVEEAEESDA